MSIHVVHDFLDRETYDCMWKFVTELEYVQGHSNSGRPIDRDQVWFQEDGHYFCEAWKSRHERWIARPYCPELHDLQEYMQGQYPCTPNLNSCLVNRYKDGTQFIPPHRDSAQSFGEECAVYGLSLGATRTLRIQNPETGLWQSVELRDNTLLVMPGHWIHEVPPDPDNTDVRYSLTFRYHKGACM